MTIELLERKKSKTNAPLICKRTLDSHPLTWERKVKKS